MRPRRLPSKLATLTCKRHRFVQEIQQTAGIVYGTFIFRLDDLPNVTEFTNLFQEYKINAVKLRFVPSYNDSTSGAVAANRLPIFHMVKDDDDIAPPTTVDQLYQYDSYQMRRTDKPFTMYIRPKALGLAYRVGVTSGQMPGKGGWMSCDTADVPYYGLKWASDLGAVNTAVSMKVFATYYIQLRSQR